MLENPSIIKLSIIITHANIFASVSRKYAVNIINNANSRNFFLHELGHFLIIFITKIILKLRKARKYHIVCVAAKHLASNFFYLLLTPCPPFRQLVNNNIPHRFHRYHRANVSTSRMNHL